MDANSHWAQAQGAHLHDLLETGLVVLVHLPERVPLVVVLRAQVALERDAHVLLGVQQLHEGHRTLQIFTCHPTGASEWAGLNPRCTCPVELVEARLELLAQLQLAVGEPFAHLVHELAHLVGEACAAI